MTVQTPQTISFVLRVTYKWYERYEAGKPEFVDFEFEDFCEMIEFAHKEKRRRSKSDRATAAEYRQVLTEHGREMIGKFEADPDTFYYYSPEKYRDAIDGTWFKIHSI